jgi:hypothetical protein
MNDELFTIPETLSPRLLWIAANCILTHHAPHCPEAPWIAIQPFDGDRGKEVGEIMAESCRLYDDADAIGYGQTEDEAIVSLAKKLNLRLWNEV